MLQHLRDVIGSTDDSAALVKDRNMKAEVENALRRTETRKYVVEVCKNNLEITEMVEDAYADDVRAEHERRLAIDRAGGPDAFKAAELLASTTQRVRKVNNARQFHNPHP